MIKKEKMNLFKQGTERSLSFGYLLIVGVALAWSMTAGIISTTEFQRDYRMALVRTFFIVVILGLMFSHRHFFWIGGMILAGFLIFTISGFLYLPEEPNQANLFARLLIDTVRYLNGEERHAIEYERVVIWAISILIGFVVVLFCYYRFWFLLLFAVGGVTFGILLSSPYFGYYRSFYVFLFSIMILLVHYLHQRSAKKSLVKSPFTKLALPIAAACLILAAVIPTPQVGAMQGTMQNAISRPFNFINDMFYNVTRQSEFSLRQTGFGGYGQLGRPVQLNHELFMRVRTDGSLPLYLTGGTADTYTGYSWLNKHREDSRLDFSTIYQNIELFEYTTINVNPQELELMAELIYQNLSFWVIQVEPEIVDIYSLPSHHTLEIDVLGFRPSTVFHTDIVRNIFTEEEERVFLRDREGRILTEPRFTRHSRYTVLYIPKGQGHIRDAHLLTSPIERSYPGLFRDIHEVLSGFYEEHQIDLFPITYQMGETSIWYRDLLENYLIPRAERIHETYTALPEEFPERVRELAYNITNIEGAASSSIVIPIFDGTIGRVRSIEMAADSVYARLHLLSTFLSNNFRYTLTPELPQEGMDFVEFFLFESQEGYCVHFATAFVVMARSIGLPARYVEGFLVYGEPDAAGFIDVPNSMAHAWAEVYFEGHGWVRFEPTPSSGLPQLAGTEGNAGGGGGGGGDDWEYWLHEYYMQHYLYLYGELGGSEHFAPGGSQQDEGSGFINHLTLWNGILLFLGLAVISLLLRILWNVVRHKRSKRRANFAAVVYSFRSILACMRLLGYERREEETASRFINRISKEVYTVSLKDRGALEEATEIFVKARYSEEDISQEERMEVEQVVRNLDYKLKIYIGKARYFYYRYILAIV